MLLLQFCGAVVRPAHASVVRPAHPTFLNSFDALLLSSSLSPSSMKQPQFFTLYRPSARLEIFSERGLDQLAAP